MRPPRRGEIWAVGTEPALAVLVISSTVYNEIPDEPTVIAAIVKQHTTDEGFCVDLGEGQWAVMCLVTYIPKANLTECLRRVDTQTLTNANNMLFKILATPDR